jgi:DNA repair exonuclease SbcCD ATPase subunit
MRYHLPGLLALALLTAAVPNAGRAADDDTARLREILHRTQEALRQAQADNADLSRAKLDADHKLDDSTKQLEAVRSTSQKAQSGKAAALQAQLDAAHTAQENGQHGLDDANSKLAAVNSKLAEALKQLAARDTQVKEISQALDQSKTANNSCEAKNVTLYGYAEEVLQRYKKKGVWASLSQKDPMFGLKEVDVENVVQEYQLKFNAQKVKP